MATRWYSSNQRLETVDHEDVSTNEALQLADRYLSALRTEYEWGEEAMEATVFGFVRDDESYMQVSLHRHDCIDIEYDFSPIHVSLFSRLFSHERQYSERLGSREALRARIEMFFAYSSKSMREHLAKELVR